MPAVLRRPWVLINIFVATVVIGPIVLFLGLFDWRKRIMGFFPSLWGRWLIWSLGLPTTIRGLDNLEKGRQYLFVCNHASAIDIMLAVSYLPGTVAFMAKKSLFNVPLFGWAIRSIGCIPVDRSNRIKAQRSVDVAVAKLQRTLVNIILYPEGTRTRDGQLQPFKSGGFLLAIRSGIPIVPVAVKGTFQALRSGALNLTTVPVSLTIGVPVSTSGLTDDDRNELKDQAHKAVSDLLSAAPRSAVPPRAA